MKYEMITALTKDCHAKIAVAKMNVYILLNNPVGVGDHPNVMGTIQNELDIISQNQGRLSVLQEEFKGD